jgi:hypothetical protein
MSCNEDHRSVGKTGGLYEGLAAGKAGAGSAEPARTDGLSCERHEQAKGGRAGSCFEGGESRHRCCTLH